MHTWAFIGVAAVLIVVPGPDTALVTRNALLAGRRAALATALGVSTGLIVWTLAGALGVAALIHASALAFSALKLLGGAYLILLGLRALRGAGRPHAPAARRAIDGARGFRQGLLSNLANPKIAALFTSLLPQFVSPRPAAAGPVRRARRHLRGDDRDLPGDRAPLRLVTHAMRAQPVRAELGAPNESGACDDFRSAWRFESFPSDQSTEPGRVARSRYPGPTAPPALPAGGG